MKVIIIGAGLAGLTFGALAAKNGHEVVIYEKNNVVGGVTSLLENDGFKFEQGPLLIGDMLKGEPIYEFLSSLDIHLETIRADRDSSFPDFKIERPNEYLGPYWRKDYLKSIFPSEAKGLDRYYKFYDDVMHLRYLSTLPPSPLNKIRLAYNFLKIKKYSKMSAQQLVSTFFKDEKLQAVYTAIFADFCADPNEVSALGVVFTNFETAFDERIPLYKNSKKYYPGFCYIKGGCHLIAESLANYITSHNGKIYFNTIVDKVLIKDNNAYGVLLDNKNEDHGDVIVGCGAGKDFFKNVVGYQYLTEEYIKIVDEYIPMEAVFMLHLGVDYNPLDYMRCPLCYYYGTYNLHEATKKLRNNIYHNGNDGYLIFVPNAHADTFAPDGKHCVTIYTVAPDKLIDKTWDEVKEKYADDLIKLAERQLPELSKHIISKKIMTAKDYRIFTHSSKSSFGGNVPIMDLKTPPHITPINNLYFVGQQSENGGGLGAVIMGAKDTFNKSKL